MLQFVYQTVFKLFNIISKLHRWSAHFPIRLFYLDKTEICIRYAALVFKVGGAGLSMELVIFCKCWYHVGFNMINPSVL